MVVPRQNASASHGCLPFMQYDDLYPAGVNASLVVFPQYEGEFDPWENVTVDSSQHAGVQDSYQAIRQVAYGSIMPIILALGIVGNSINILVFSQRMRQHMDAMEKSATIGLISLAVADLLFCLVGFPSAFVEARGSVAGGVGVVALYYTTYRGALLNVFLFMSTWFIITLSLERYFAIAHPFVARSFVRVRRTAAIKLLLVLFSLLINVPDFLRYKVKFADCEPAGACLCYYAEPNLFFHHTQLAYAYSIVWHVFGTFIPLVILTFCNVRLLMEIYRSTSKDKHISPSVRSGSSSGKGASFGGSCRGSGCGGDNRDPTKITFILVAIVTLFLVLVCPSMILSFLKDVALYSAGLTLQHYQIALVITNLGQAANFSLNFLLYCVVSPRFRQQVAGDACKRLSRTSSRTIVSDAAGGVTSRNTNNNSHNGHVAVTCQYELVEMKPAGAGSNGTAGTDSVLPS